MSELIKKAKLLDEKVLIGVRRKKEEEPQGEKASEIDPGAAMREEAARILAGAKAEAEKILADARAEAGQIKTEARTAGYREGSEAAVADWSQKVSALGGLVANLTNGIDSSVEDLKGSLVDLAISVIREITLAEADKTEISAKIDRALDMVKASKRIVLRLSDKVPSDVIERLSKVEKLQVVTEPSFEFPDANIEADFGALDLRVNSQLELFESIVKKAFGTDR